MITIKTESPLENGHVRRRYEITLTDLNGNTHTEIVGIFNHLPTNTGAQVEVDLLSAKKQQEQEEYKQDISLASNPFNTKILKWNTRSEMLKAILDEALSKPATEAIVYNGLPYLSSVTDTELMALYNKTQVWVTDVRSKVTTLLTAKTTLDAYKAVI